MGHSRSRAISEFGRCVLSRRRLLCARVRRDVAHVLQELGELAWRVPHTGVATRSREFPLRCHRQQGRLGRLAHCHDQKSHAMVSGEEQRALLWDVGQGGHQCRAGVSDNRQECVGARKRARHVRGHTCYKCGHRSK